MVVGYVMVGLLAGAFASALSLLTGQSGWAAVGWLVLGSNVGLLACVLVAGLSGSLRARRAGRPGWVSARSLAMFVLSSLALGWAFAR